MTSKGGRSDEAMCSGSDSETKGGDCTPQSSSESDSDHEESEQATQLEQLKAALLQNPNNYDAHVQYIGILRKVGALDELRQARHAMNALFPLSPGMWREWTQDEARLACSAEDVASVEALYDLGVQDYLSVPLWVDYLEFVEGHDANVAQCTPQGLAKMRALFERALAASCLHLADGSKIWEAYREFEQAVLLTISEDDCEARAKQVDMVRSIFQRQLTVPLLNHADTLREYREWEEEQGSAATNEGDELAGLPPNIVLSYTKALKICSKYRSMEEMIASGKPGDAELLKNYQLYIDLEEDTKDPARVQVIYERSIADFPVSTDLWLKYTEYLDFNLKVPSIIKSVYARAVRNCPWIGELWKRYLLALERSGTQENEISSVYERSLQSGLQTPTEYMDLFLTRADSLRRMHFRESETNETGRLAELKKLQETFDHASQFLTTYFPDYVDRSLQLYRYWARLEVQLANNVMAARGVWEKLIKSSGWMTEVWKSYISMEVELRNIKEARSLYRRCYSQKLEANGAELICYEWLSFEREYGSLEDYDRAVLKVRPRLAEIKAMQTAQEAKAGTSLTIAATTQELAFPDGNPKNRQRLQKGHEAVASNKRRRDVAQKDSDFPSKRKKTVIKKANVAISASKETNDNEQEEDVAATKADQSTKESSHQKKESKSSSVVQHVFTDKCTAFVSNIPFEVTEDQLREFFLPCGGLKDVRMMRDRYTGRPRGIAYIDFETEESLLAAIERNKQKLYGRPLSVARSNPEVGRSKPSHEPATRHGHEGAHKSSSDISAKGEESSERSDHPRMVPMMVGHRRAGQVKLVGSNTFAVPRKLVKPLGWGKNEQKPTEAGDDTPKSNEEFRKMLLQS